METTLPLIVFIVVSLVASVTMMVEGKELKRLKHENAFLENAITWHRTNAGCIGEKK